MQDREKIALMKIGESADETVKLQSHPQSGQELRTTQQPSCVVQHLRSSLAVRITAAMKILAWRRVQTVTVGSCFATFSGCAAYARQPGQ
jgi:hypothetical protein